jgi:hypothetical protein
MKKSGLPIASAVSLMILKPQKTLNDSSFKNLSQILRITQIFLDKTQREFVESLYSKGAKKCNKSLMKQYD